MFGHFFVLKDTNLGRVPFGIFCLYLSVSCGIMSPIQSIDSVISSFPWMQFCKIFFQLQFVETLTYSFEHCSTFDRNILFICSSGVGRMLKIQTSNNNKTDHWSKRFDFFFQNSIDSAYTWINKYIANQHILLIDSTSVIFVDCGFDLFNKHSECILNETISNANGNIQ